MSMEERCAKVVLERMPRNQKAITGAGIVGRVAKWSRKIVPSTLHNKQAEREAFPKAYVLAVIQVLARKRLLKRTYKAVKLLRKGSVLAEREDLERSRFQLSNTALLLFRGTSYIPQMTVKRERSLSMPVDANMVVVRV